MNQNEKYSVLLDFVASIAKLSCDVFDDPCLSCEAVALLRRVTAEVEDAPVDTGE